MELTLKQNASSSVRWALACSVLGLFIGPWHPFGLLSLAGGAVFALRAMQAFQGKEFLKIDAAGFTYSSFFKEKRVEWADLEAVKVLTYRYLGLIPYRRMVVLRYVPGRRGGTMRRAAGWVNGWDEMLPGTYGLKAQALAALLEEHRQQADISGLMPRQTIA